MGDPTASEPSDVPPIPEIQWPSKYESDIPFAFASGLPLTIGCQWRSAGADSPAFVTLRRGKIGGYQILQRFPLTQEGWASAWKSLLTTDRAAAEAVKAALGDGEPGATRRRPWSLSDRISVASFIITLVALLAIVGGVPGIVDFYPSKFKRPEATIVFPEDGQVLATNRIGVKGTAERIPGDSDLWLSVSGGSDEIYPVAQLKEGKWSASEKQVCFLIGPGPQRFDVWVAPDTDDGRFVAFMQLTEHPSGLFSVPAGFVKLCQINFRVRDMSNCRVSNVPKPLG
jgi:hypothetical protein